MTRGVCNKCGKVYEPDAPNIGYFCGDKYKRPVKLADGTNTILTGTCLGIVVRHAWNSSDIGTTISDH